MGTEPMKHLIEVLNYQLYGVGVMIHDLAEEGTPCLSIFSAADFDVVALLQPYQCFLTDNILIFRFVDHWLTKWFDATIWMVKLLDDVLAGLEGGFDLLFELGSLFLSYFLYPYLTFFVKDVCVMFLQLHMFYIYYFPI